MSNLRASIRVSKYPKSEKLDFPLRKWREQVGERERESTTDDSESMTDDTAAGSNCAGEIRMMEKETCGETEKSDDAH